MRPRLLTAVRRGRGRLDAQAGCLGPRLRHRGRDRRGGVGLGSLGLSAVTAMIHPDDAASVRVARRLGFAPRREDTLLGKPVTVYALDAPAA